MPGRIIPLVTDEIYHVFNRGIDHRPTFLNKREFERAKEVITFYRFAHLPFRLSIFLLKSQDRRKEIMNKLNNNTDRLVEIISYCLMPNHFHFILKQKVQNGIAKFMSNFQNSYTRYFNTKNKRTGPLFLDQFKAIRIETDEQLLHVSRYLHLNPYTSYLVKTSKNILSYPWSSILEILRPFENICQTDMILTHFKTKKEYKRFILDQADYQRNLEKIKHLICESIT
ncbi:hypothetical protein FJY90_03155 [Candidatus Gottesmanbacteria bacterium]|nr:hypothetical protein [Candidatus Gottesmanbacteria bacterium]